MGCMLTRYGRREWLAGSAILGCCCAAIVALGLLVNALLWLLLPAPVAVWAWLLWFFRDPPRRTPSEPGLFVSPADGRVADITPLGDDSPLGCPGVQIGIFMSVFDVHVNRAAEAGRVERVEHRHGVFLDARDPCASGRNESAAIHLTCRRGGGEFPVVIRQVAGLIARRIVTDLRGGEELSRGQRLGMIKFGSRVELMAPRELAGEIRVRIGQRVRAGETVLIASGPGDRT